MLGIPLATILVTGPFRMRLPLFDPARATLDRAMLAIVARPAGRTVRIAGTTAGKGRKGRGDQVENDDGGEYARHKAHRPRMISKSRTRSSLFLCRCGGFLRRPGR